jgi:pilus assembly protein FimV
MNNSFFRRSLVASTALGLMLASAAAAALGLGEIRVRSKPGQPLVAEIPIISTEPGELEQLQARLASADVFARVGLEPPRGLVSGLEFMVTMSDDNRAVIRVTSREPVQVSAVNFLIEVNWGQGRLVREYSALVDAPGTLAAGAGPAIEAPLPPPSNAIIRDPEAVAVAPAPADTAPPPEPAAEPASPRQGASAPVARAPAPSAAALQAAAGDGIEVQRGQTLSQIARDLGQGYSLDQTMVALLRANPEAFIRGNVNLLKAGAVLRVPPPDEVAQLQAGEATALVREQNAQWRQARQPIPQPVDAAAAPAATPSGSAAQGPQVAQARLEIAPPAADAATRAGTQSGIDAEGEGDMLANQQLTATREDLAARESEVQELRAQVAELENLQKQQAQLIELKDSELAAAQQQLAANQGGGQPLWLWAGLALLVFGLVAAWLMSRRRPVAPLVRAGGYDTAAMAAAVPAAGSARMRPDLAERDDADEATVAVSTPAAAAPEEPPPAAPAPPAPVPPAPAPVRAGASVPPAWSGTAAGPTWHTGDAGAGLAPLNSAPAGRERLELAIAYMDLGDVETARELLNEVVAGGDARARDEASQLLRELG